MKPVWYDTFFRGIAVDFWRTALPQEYTDTEVNFLDRTLRSDSGVRLLDVPCGTGRHLIPLAKRGFAMTGVDISGECIAATREDAGGMELDLHTAEMRELPWERAFDGAYCCGNSFGYMNPAGAVEFLAAIHRTLKPEARFVLECGMAAESILPTLVPGRDMEAGDITVRSETKYDACDSRLDIDYTFQRGGLSETRASSHYVMTVSEIRRMLEAAGFSIDAILGEMSEASPYQLRSPRLVMVARVR